MLMQVGTSHQVTDRDVSGADHWATLHVRPSMIGCANLLTAGPTVWADRV
jgi:hypothetical protein